MSKSFFQELFDAWALVKVKLRLPLPRKNHFYKGRRISMKRNWFCKSCSCVFHLTPWKQYKNEPAHHLTCPNCGNKAILWTTFIFMAVIDKKPKEYLHWLLNLTTEQIIEWLSKHKTL